MQQRSVMCASAPLSVYKQLGADGRVTAAREVMSQQLQPAAAPLVLI